MEAAQLPEHLQAGLLLPAGVRREIVPGATISLQLQHLDFAQELRRGWRRMGIIIIDESSTQTT